MGRDKALLPTPEGPLLLRICGIAKATGLQVIVSGRDRPVKWPDDDVSFFRDRYEDAGPLAGIESALAACGCDVLAIGCDMPLMTAPAIEWLWQQAMASQDEFGVAPLNDGRPEPMFSLYRRGVVAELERRIRAGNLALMPLVRSEQFAHPPVPPLVRNALANVNTPEEFAAISFGAVGDHRQEEPSLSEQTPTNYRCDSISAGSHPRHPPGGYPAPEGMGQEGNG